MSPQHEPHTESPTTSNLPAITLVVVIALWYAWAVALLLVQVL
jgi:hypothetical protein